MVLNVVVDVDADVDERIRVKERKCFGRKEGHEGTVIFMLLNEMWSRNHYSNLNSLDVDVNLVILYRKE